MAGVIWPLAVHWLDFIDRSLDRSYDWLLPGGPKVLGIPATDQQGRGQDPDDPKVPGSRGNAQVTVSYSFFSGVLLWCPSLVSFSGVLLWCPSLPVRNSR